MVDERGVDERGVDERGAGGREAGEREAGEPGAGGAPTLRFRLPDGSVRAVVAEGSVYTVMTAAKRAGIPGIEGQCGGNRACATCHVHVDPEWMAVVGPPGRDERELIGLTDDPRPTSRLACQIALTGALDGLVVTPVR